MIFVMKVVVGGFKVEELKYDILCDRIKTVNSRIVGSFGLSLS